ncbi:MAG: TatD family hydrolase, partial [Pseudomonadota bacterium]
MIDIGANLSHDSFDADRDEVIAAAFTAGVEQIVVTGSSGPSNRDAVALSRKYPTRLFATAGMHPHYAADYNADLHREIGLSAADGAIVAVGECGLDYYRNLSSPKDQQQAFEAQLDIAEQTGLPLFLHQRDAIDDFARILAPRRSRLGQAIAHCFTGQRDELEVLLDLDLSIGITGWICDERRGLHLRELVRDIPPERLMIETDAPYLLPRTLRPKPKTRRNEPKWLGEVARVVAQSLDMPTAELGALTTANARRFFALPAPAGAT